MKIVSTSVGCCSPLGCSRKRTRRLQEECRWMLTAFLSTSSSRWSSITSLIFNLLCLLGFSYQAITFVKSFFEYSTESDLRISTPTEISVPDFTACFRYVDVIDVNKLNQKYPTLAIKPLENLPSNRQMNINIKKIQTAVTIEDILRLTPKAEDIVSGCSIKGPKDFEFRDFSSPEQCNRYFSIWKFYLQEYICYRIKRLTQDYQDPTPFQYRSVSYAIDRAGVLFSVKMSDTNILKARYMKAVIHDSNRNPISSLAMTTNIKRRFDDEENAGRNPDDVKKNYFIFQLTYSELKMTRLPPPYDTGCKNYITEGILSAIECRNECLVNHTIAKLGKVPFSASLWNTTTIIQFITTYGEVSNEVNEYLSTCLEKEQQQTAVLKYQHLTNQDMKNVTVSHQLIQIEDQCHQECKRPDCEDVIALTRGSYDYIRPENLDLPSKQPLEFEISAPKKPVIAINYKEKISQTEFLVYILSCFGIWFGLSVLSVCPFRLTLSLHDRMKKDETFFLNSLMKRTSRKDQVKAGQTGWLHDKNHYNNKNHNNSNKPKDYCLSMRMSVEKEIRQEIEAVKQSLSTSTVSPEALTRPN